MKAQGGLPFDAGDALAQVAVSAPVTSTFTYRIPPAMAGAALPGMRVRVRFSGRVLDAVVVATGTPAPTGIDPTSLQPLLDCPDPEPLLSPTMLVLAQRLADDLLVGWGEILQLALPGGEPALARRARRLREDAGGVEDPVERKLLRHLGRGRTWKRLTALTRGDHGGMAAAYRLQRSGHIEIEDEWSGADPGATLPMVQRAVGMPRPEALAACVRAPAQRRVIETLWDLPEGPVLELSLLQRAEAGATVLAALESKGLVRRVRASSTVSASPVPAASGAGTFALTADQQSALAAVVEQMDAAMPQGVLLHGVTGSGKTEVYLRAARAALAAGRTALLLVPEIGLTPQLQARAIEVFGDDVAVLHSAMAMSERQQGWWRARRREARVVVGPRSAVFAPLEGVGLIVVDEEQDSAYKQDERPRYLGREVARARAGIEGAVLVLGSATPSIESYWSASMGQGKLLRMPARVGTRTLPHVERVDMRQEWRATGRTLVSRRLEEGIADRLRRREQVLLLLNRRGFASAVMCRACGARVECPHCAVSLTLHRGRSALVCHYCDHSEPAQTLCRQCGADAMHELGQGTERLQLALQRRFADARIGRFDADQTRVRGAHARILGAFAVGEIDLLVGTQMLAKGHDFPGVTLVGVVGADASLGMPDFRAAERTFQLLTQMAGRAGRGDVPGEVVVQALEPEHYAIRAAAAHDYETFFTRELEYRRRLRYPPFVALAACLCRGKVAAVVAEEADRWATALRGASGGGTAVIGPATPPIGRLRGAYRMQVIVKAVDSTDLATTLRAATDELARRRQLPRDLVIDIDPQSLM